MWDTSSHTFIALFIFGLFLAYGGWAIFRSPRRWKRILPSTDTRERGRVGAIHINYRNGESHSWELHERGAQTEQLLRHLWRAWDENECVAFAVAYTATVDDPNLYAMVGVKMAEVISFRIEGFVDDQGLLGPWADAQDA